MPHSYLRSIQVIRALKILVLLEPSQYGMSIERLRAELVESLGLSGLNAKTVKRDIEALQAVGFNISDEEQPGAFKLRRHHTKVPELPISAIELLALATARKLALPGLVHLRELTHFQSLDLSHTKISDTGLVHLKGLNNLQKLYLSSTQLTDAGLVHLKGLTNLQALRLAAPQVTDAGLAHLKGLVKLETLYLQNTQITDAGLAHLKGLTNLQSLGVLGSISRRSGITDAGLVHLKGLVSLKTLYLRMTKVTDTGVAELKKALPNCKISK